MADGQSQGFGYPGSKSPAPLPPWKRNSPRTIGIFALLWSLIALAWLGLTLWELLQGDRDVVQQVIVVLYLGVAVAFIVMWRRAKRSMGQDSGGAGQVAGEPDARP